MRIVDRKTFLKMEGQVLFAKYDPQIFGDLRIKVGDTQDFSDDNPKYHDFQYDDLIDFDCMGSTERMDLLHRAEQDPFFSVDLDPHYTSRDGMFEDDILFAVFEPQDVKQLIERLQEVLGE